MRTKCENCGAREAKFEIRSLGVKKMIPQIVCVPCANEFNNHNIGNAFTYSPIRGWRA